jgi:hypothetical protein
MSQLSFDALGLDSAALQLDLRYRGSGDLREMLNLVRLPRPGL